MSLTKQILHNHLHSRINSKLLFKVCIKSLFNPQMKLWFNVDVLTKHSRYSLCIIIYHRFFCRCDALGHFSLQWLLEKCFNLFIEIVKCQYFTLSCHLKHLDLLNFSKSELLWQPVGYYMREDREFDRT